jgi:bacteriocin biosynthesis cyclodehydratase domain-containing protein
MGAELSEAVATVARYAGVEVPRHPRLVPWVVVADIGDGRLELRGSDVTLRLGHPLLAEVFRGVAPLLDGCHTLAELTEPVADDLEATSVALVLKMLRANGLLQEGQASAGVPGSVLGTWQRQIDFLAHFHRAAAAAQAALLRARVEIVGDGELADALSAALRSIGIDPDAEAVGDDRDLVLACGTGPSVGLFEAVNQRCLTTGTRWLIAEVTGTLAVLGPTIIPHQTACYSCLQGRLRSHRADTRRMELASGEIGDDGALAPLRTVLAANAALEVLRLLTGFASPATIGRYLRFSAARPTIDSHTVLRLPRCPDCRPPAPRLR